MSGTRECAQTGNRADDEQLGHPELSLKHREVHVGHAAAAERRDQSVSPERLQLVGRRRDNGEESRHRHGVYPPGTLHLRLPGTVPVTPSSLR